MPWIVAVAGKSLDKHLAVGLLGAVALLEIGPQFGAAVEFADLSVPAHMRLAPHNLPGFAGQPDSRFPAPFGWIDR